MHTAIIISLQIDFMVIPPSPTMVAVGAKRMLSQAFLDKIIAVAYNY
jgi:hypothetical protein